MRILKRNLAFVMVLAMALGMMVTASAANVEDYKDANDITFVEAVDVLTSLGILEGDQEVGTFAPQDTLTREQGAKIIAYLMLGKDGADNLKTASAPFADVAANRWSAGYVAYCVSQGIVGGYGNGNFGPNDTLTGTQFAKMLLVALGYGVNGEYTGPNWEIETNKTALVEGIYEGNLGANFSAGVKREEAAQYAFNTLANVMEVNYSDVFGAYYSGKIFNSVSKFDRDYTLGKRLYKLDQAAAEDYDAMGRDCYVWKAGAKILTGNYHEEADAVYTKDVKISQIYKDLGLTTSVDAAAYVNGAKQTNDVTLKKDESTKLSAKNTDATAGIEYKAGMTVEAYVTERYDDDANKYVNDVTLIAYNTYLAQVTAYDADDKEVTVKFISTGVSSTRTFETGVEYEKDEFVLVTVADGKIQTLEPAVLVEGKMESKGSDYVRFEGEKYTLSINNKLTTDINYDTTYNLILDKNNYALALDVVEEGADEEIGYVYVTRFQAREENLLNGNAAVVEVRYLDGTGTETLPLETKKVDGTLSFRLISDAVDHDSNDDTPKQYDKFAKTPLEATKDNWYKVAETDGAEDVGKFFAYFLNDNGDIVLKDLAKTDAHFAEVSNETTIEGEVSFEGKAQGTVAGETFEVNSKSVVSVIDDNDKVTTYTGTKNIKFEAKTKGGSTPKSLIVTDGSKMIKQMYVLSDAETSSDNIYAYYTGKSEAIADGKTQIELYIDGEASWKVVANDDGVPAGGKGVYVVTLNSNDEVTVSEDKSNVEDKWAIEENKIVTAVEDNYFKTLDSLTETDWNNSQLPEDDDNYAALNGEAEYYFADGDKEVQVYDVTDGLKTSSIDVKNQISLVKVEGRVTYIFITKADGLTN